MDCVQRHAEIATAAKATGGGGNSGSRWYSYRQVNPSLITPTSSSSILSR